MSIDKIQLPPLLFASIFNDKLVYLDKKSGKPAHTPDATIEYLGGNEKKIVFVVNNGEHKFLEDKELTFLLNLMEACKITMQEIAVVNTNSNSYSYRDLRKALSGRKFLCFGVSSVDLDLPFTIPFYQVQPFEEARYLFCPDLKKIGNDAKAKKILWESLRKIFNIGRKR